MKHIIDDIHKAVSAEVWYPALAMSLTIPDICGKIEWPDEKKVRTRYTKWFDNEMSRFYPPRPKTNRGPFLTGSDCYALRCAFLHAGDFDLDRDGNTEILKQFVFVVPPSNVGLHCNRVNSSLQLQVSIFCEEMCDAAGAWVEKHIGNPQICERIGALPGVHILPKTGPMSFQL